MLKLAIAATVSILSLLPIASITNARSITRISNYNLNSQSKPFSIAKQYNANRNNNDVINESEMKGIRAAIINFYKHKNEQILNHDLDFNRKNGRDPNFGAFCNVESLKLISLSEQAATVAVTVDMSGYSGVKISEKPVQWAFKKNTGLNNNILKRNSGEIMLVKKEGKWIARTDIAQCW